MAMATTTTPLRLLLLLLVVVVVAGSTDDHTTTRTPLPSTPPVPTLSSVSMAGWVHRVGQDGG
jgi:hypothetical protein